MQPHKSQMLGLNLYALNFGEHIDTICNFELILTIYKLLGIN